MNLNLNNGLLDYDQKYGILVIDLLIYLSITMSLIQRSRLPVFKQPSFPKPMAIQVLIAMLFVCFCAIGIFIQTPVAVAQNLTSTSPTLIASLFHFSGTPPKNLGVNDGKLAACPISPNCVGSQEADEAHKIAPLTYTGNSKEAFDLLNSIVRSLDNAAIVEEQTNYFSAEFTSKLMGFVDDVEFYLDETAGVIQVRSASRLGESDLGVNRQRIETIRSKFKA
jgi:uncharacterized protein (DUF1499 family)